MINNVLLTGANGFLGNYIYNYLNSINYKIDTLSRDKSAVIICNLANTVPKLNNNYDFVIHSAGKAHSVPKTKDEKQEFETVNYLGTINLCKALEKKIPKNFIFISTIAVYGKDKGENISESENLNGKTPYAISKIKAEKFLLKWSKENNVNLIILRLPLVAGKLPKGNLETMINGIKNGYYFNINKSKALKSIVLAQDVAKLIPTLQNKNGIYNLAGKKDYSFKEIAMIITKQLGNKRILNLPYFFVKFIAYFGDVFSFVPINSSKLKKINSTLTVSSKKAIIELEWNPNTLEGNFKIK